MRKFTPLDLSFIANAGSPERESFRNVAALINANAGWSQPSQVMLKEYKKIQDNAKREASKHKPTFISGLFDLLSVPLYGVANALDESIAGHQSDNNDGLLEDAAKTIGGVFTGGAKGIGAGLRGATSMLDTLPGVDISDDWQQDRTDKSRFGDVNIRLGTKMSTADAMKPENLEKALGNVRREKGEVPGWLSDIFYGDVDTPDSQESLQNFLKRSQQVGIAEDIGGDPLNFIPLSWGKKATDASKAIEGLEAARTSKGPEDIIAGLRAPINAEKGLKFGELPVKGEAKVADEAMLPGTKIPITNVAEDIGKGGIKTPAQVGARKGTPVAGLEISLRDQEALARKITGLAARNEPNWVYKAADILRAHPKIDFADTGRFLKMADEMAKRRNIRHNPSAFSTSLKARIASDVQRARKVVPAERVLNTANPADIVIAPTKAKLRPQQAQIANNVIAKFQKEILGGARAPGTYEGLAVAQRAGLNSRWSGPQQGRMWNQITTALKNVPGPKRYDIAAKILQHVEDFFLAKGAVPYSSAKISESVEGLRLSQIAMTLGPKAMAENPNLVTKLLRGDEAALKSLTPEQLQQIENLKASEAMASAPAAAEGIAAGKAIASDIMKGPLSAARKKDAMNAAIRGGTEFTLRANAGPVAARTVQTYLNKLLKDPTGLDAVLKSSRFNTEGFLARSATMGSKFNPVDKAFTTSVTNAIAKAADLPSPASLGTFAGPAARVKDWLGARFNAAYGVADMRPIFLRNQASALSTSARRGAYINALAKAFPPKDIDVWHEAFRAAQMDALTAGRVSDLQKEVSKVMENLFGGTGLKAGAIADSTVVGRSHLYMNELNAQMRRFGLGQYQFSNKAKVKDAAGNVHDFSSGADWLKSWEAWNVTRPYEFLHQVQTAIEHTVREKTMFDEIATRFGSTKKHGAVKFGVGHPRLAGYYFTEEAARQGEQFIKILKEVNTPNSKGLQHLDHVISKLKASLTIYIPSHHWTNIIGDVMFNWYAGVNNVKRYEQAAKVMGAQKGRYGDIADFGKLVGPDAMKQAISRGMVGTEALTASGLKVHAAGNSVITTMKNGQKVTADMIYTAAMKEGILPSARVLEEVTSEVTSVLDKFRPLGGRGQKAAHTVSEIRDHIPRLAQFIDGISKSKGSFAGAVEGSAANVRKWHPDGLDITKFERNVMKRVFPFYSWTRKAIPLAIESSVVAGNKVMAYPRLMEEIALANGVDAEPGSQFPGDQLFPDWMRERGIGPVAGGPGSYLMVNPSTPVLDIASMMGHPGQTTLDMLNPMGRVPLELSQGATLGKQVPIENNAEYLAMQVPGLSQAGRVSGAYGTSDAVANSEEQQRLNLINLLFGTKATQSGIYQKSAQFDLRDYLKERAKEQRGG